jgi:hypothetical protein
MSDAACAVRSAFREEKLTIAALSQLLPERLIEQVDALIGHQQPELLATIHLPLGGRKKDKGAGICRRAKVRGEL